MSGAVGHKRVSKDWIENYLISFPKSKADQNLIVRRLDALRTETQKLEAIYQKKIANLEELRKSILGKAFKMSESGFTRFEDLQDFSNSHSSFQSFSSFNPENLDSDN